MKILILAGGSGTRLWPLSRGNYPKQFVKFLKMKDSLFQLAFLRAKKLVENYNIYVITNLLYQNFVKEQIEELGEQLPEENILVEPEGKDTLPAIYYGVNEACKGRDEIVLVFPSDHLIVEEEVLIQTVRETIPLAEKRIVTFGVKALYPHMGYGYIAEGESIENGFLVKRFIEKPSEKKALEYMKKGYLWNSGIFMFSSTLFIEEVKQYAYPIFSAFCSNKDIVSIFKCIEPHLSIDYGIMEKTKIAAVVPLNIHWSDLGSFDSFAEVFPRDARNNIAYNGEILVESSDNLVISEDSKKVVVAGVKDLIIVDHKDGLLICNKKQSEKLKEVVKKMNLK